MQELLVLLVALGIASTHPSGNFLEQGAEYRREKLSFPADGYVIPVTRDSTDNKEEAHVQLTPMEDILEPSRRRLNEKNINTILYRQPHRYRRWTGTPNIPTGTQGSNNGGIGGGVRRTDQGTHVEVNAERNIHRSQDGRTSVDAHGKYERVYNGPGAGKPNYNVGVRVSHKW